MTHWYV